MALTLFIDTYCTVETAETILGGNPAWDDSTLGQKELALRTATAILDNQEGWLGIASTADQSLAWPRASFSYFDKKLNRIVFVEEGTIPPRLTQATAWLALHYLTYPSAATGYEATWDSITVGPISLSNGNAQADPGTIPRVPTNVVLMIGPLLSGGGLGKGIAWWRAN